jgi:hypothetical protein
LRAILSRSHHEYPTDTNLLLDAIRKVIRTVRGIGYMFVPPSP